MVDFRTADLCDEFGGDVAVAAPLFRSYGGRRRFAGMAATIRCFEDNSRVREAVAEPGDGRVLVVDGAGSQRCALLGDLLGAKAVANGWVGLVINGCVRDTAALADMDLGVLALATCPRRSEKKGLGDRDVTVEFAGVSIRPGDLVYADEDGLIVSHRPLV